MTPNQMTKEDEIANKIISIMLDTHIEFLPHSDPTHEDSELYMIMAKRIVKAGYSASQEGLDEPFPFIDVLRLLSSATKYLLDVKDYDGPDYEELEICVKRAEKIIKASKQATPVDGDWSGFIEWTHTDECPFVFKVDRWYQYADDFEMSTSDLYNFYIKKHGQQTPVDGWIGVKSGLLPEDRERVLVFKYTRQIKEALFIKKDEWDRINQFIIGGAYYDIEKWITHWMPMPNPPKSIK